MNKFTLCIGSGVENITGNHFIICLPGEKLPAGMDGSECNSEADAVFALRMRFANPAEIVITLPHCQIVLGKTDQIETQESWRKAILWRFHQIVDELGNDPLDAWMGVENMYGLCKVLPNALTSDGFMGVHAGQPAVCIGAGPTANDYLPDIAKKRASLRVFCTDVMVNACLKHGFEPDYICSIERIPGTAKVFADIPKLEHAKLLCPPVIPPICASKVNGAVFWLTGDTYISAIAGESYRKLNPGPSCGTLSIFAALEAGCGPVYLVGHDLCYADGKSHSDQSHEETKGHAAIYSDPGHAWFKQEHDAIDCFGVPTKTTGLWMSFRNSIQDELHLRSAKVYNVRTRSGLFIDGAEVIPAIGDHQALPPIEVAGAKTNKVAWKSDIAAAWDKALSKVGITFLELQAGKISKAQAAERIRISSLFEKRNIQLANYLLQQIYNSAHFHQSRGAPPDWTLARCMKSLGMVLSRHVNSMQEWEDD